MMDFKQLTSTPKFTFEFKGFKITGEYRGKTVAIYSIDSEKYASYNNYIEAKHIVSSLKSSIAEAIFYTKYHGKSIKGVDKFKELADIFQDTFGTPIHQFSLKRFKYEDNK